jgi:anti-sigma regulatory factor (Ser/Thr protein kinase)
VTAVRNTCQRLVAAVKHFEHKTSHLFVYAALLSYPICLVLLLKKVDPVSDPTTFLIKALAALAVPFGIILLQELLELVASISHSTLDSTRRQFQIVILVILRSFFKDFDKLNKAVIAGEWSDSVTKAVVKVVAILVMMGLMLWFKRLSNKAGVERLDAARHTANLYKEVAVVFLCVAVLVDLIMGGQSFDILTYISLVFIGMIIIDALFLLVTILQGHRFDDLMFDGGIVVSLILARFPIYASNTLSLTLSIVGVVFATLCLYMLVRSPELEFLGDYNEDEIERLDLKLANRLEEMDSLGAALNGFFEQHSIPKKTGLRIRLACDELISNIINYAYKDDAEHAIHLGLALADDRLLLIISDDGTAFNPFKQDAPEVDAELAARDIGGLGIHLVRNVMDKVAYERTSGRNTVTLLKEFGNELKEL